MSNDRHRHNAAYRGRDSKRTPRAKQAAKQRRAAIRAKRAMQGR